MEGNVTPAEIEALDRRLRLDATASGYFLNPDEHFIRDLVRGLIVNQRRYGYPSCPCRLSSGVSAADRDIVCPCDYRDPDLGEHGACYCALYVSQAVFKGEKPLGSVPERRPAPRQREQGADTPLRQKDRSAFPATLPYPVWRCRVCGYLCAREEPPEICPICKAKKDRFERFL